MSDKPDDPAALIALAPPEQVLLPAVVPEELTHVGVPLRSAVGAQLAIAMFLHHFTLGAWIVTLGSYVKANSGSAGNGMFTAGFIGVVYGAGPLGGMIAPFLTGLLADHVFSTEGILVVLHLAGALTMLAAVLAESQAAFYMALLLYFVCFLPSVSLMTSMTLHHLARPERDFPVVRACSTAGWVAAGVFVGWCWPVMTGHAIETTAIPMKIAIVGELVAAVYCLSLPHTPPANKGPRHAPSGLSGSQTLDLFRQPRFVFLMVVAALAHIPSQFYYAYCNVFLNWTGMTEAAAKMTLGQAVEVACMLLLPAILLRISVKTAILVGLAVWSLRFWMLSAAASETIAGRDAILYVAILVHGIAFTLVTISLQLDVDRCAGRRRRATAQGLLSVAMAGVGCFVGAELAGLAGRHLLPTELDDATVAGWSQFWRVPACISGVVFVITALFLPRDRPAASSPSASPQTPS